MSNYIIECRNEPLSSLSNPNGLWETIIQEEIELEEGDSIICRNAFIDSRATNSQKIIVPPGGETLTLSFIKYLNNYIGAKNTYTTDGSGNRVATTDATNSRVIPINNTPAQHVAQNDGNLYVSCESKTLGTEFKYLAQITFTGIDIFRMSGDFYVFLRYFNESGVVEDQRVYLYGTENGLGPFFANCFTTYDGSKTGADAPTGNGGQAIACFLADQNGQGTQIDLTYGRIDGNDRVVIPNGADGLGRTKIPNVDVGVPLPNQQFHPIEKSMEVKIPAGNYDPEDLAKLINRGLTEITGGPSANQLMGNNNFLIEVGGGINTDANNFIEITTGASENIYGYNLNNSSGAFTQFCGANQLVLSYDTSTMQFTFDFLHFPIYVDTNEEGIAIVSTFDNPLSDLDGQRVFLANKSGGIAFTNLQSQNTKTGRSSQFWSDVLGFDINPTLGDGSPNPNCILTQYTITGTAPNGNPYIVNGLPSGIPVFNRFLKDGVDVVGGYEGLDAIVDKTSGNEKALAPLIPTANTIKYSSSDRTLGITSQNSIMASESKIDYGYFLIEVKAQFQNNFITPNENRGDVVAIVSRYYELDSFTSSTASDSIIYTHQGEPQRLSSFRCRILDNKKQLAQNIGTDNTIFLEIVKAQKTPKKAIESGMTEKRK